MVCVTGVATLALFLSPGLGPPIQNPHWGELAYRPNQLRRYHIFINLFIAAMLFDCLSANNVGVMWITIEATTVFSAFIIPLKLNKASIEASWKYIILCWSASRWHLSARYWVTLTLSPCRGARATPSTGPYYLPPRPPCIPK